MKRNLIFFMMVALCSCTGTRELTYNHPLSAEYGTDYVPGGTFVLAYADARGGAQLPDVSGADVVITITDDGYKFTSAMPDTYTDVLPGCNSIVVETSGYAIVAVSDCTDEYLLDCTIRSGVEKTWIVILPSQSQELSDHGFTDVVAAQRGGVPSVLTHPFLYAYNGAWNYMGEAEYAENLIKVKLEKRETL